jgi:hypothetical protein
VVSTRDGSPASKPVIFIGSSTEALPIVNFLVPKLSGHFAVRPWNQVFRPGKFAMEVLVEELAKAHAAILIFTKDDRRELRGEMDEAARDNVVLEFGFFVSKLSRDRVWILQEAGVGIPTDILGMSTFVFESTDVFSRNATLQTFADRMREAWSGIDAAEASAVAAGILDADLGFAGTLRREHEWLAEVAEQLRRHAQGGIVERPDPIVLDSGRAALSAYSEGLDHVRERFWTTSFLDSRFWTRNDPQVIDSNRTMLMHLAKSGQHGSARRLFLIDQDPQQVAQAYKADRVHLRQMNKTAELHQSDVEFNNLRNNIGRLKAEGFEVKVVYDRDQRYSDLPPGMLDDPALGELAIYDSFRVDVFEGGRTGRVDLVRSFNPAVRSFDVYLNRATAYFEELWKAAEPIDNLMDQIGQAIRSANWRIDYASNWLARYEFALDRDDENLKVVEIKRVEEILRHTDRWGKIENYLDVGTCTGRYPIRLREAVVASGTILGIDEDFDCVRFAQFNVDRQCADDNRIKIRQTDFVAIGATLSGPFDLITCMLGTLSHFGWDRKTDGRGPFEDTLQRSLARLADLLDDSGLLLLSTWSAYACENQAMLGIYRESDRYRLAGWTPRTDELEARLKQAGLEVVSQVQPELRLDLLSCRRAQ